MWKKKQLLHTAPTPNVVGTKLSINIAAKEDHVSFSYDRSSRVGIFKLKVCLSNRSFWSNGWNSQRIQGSNAEKCYSSTMRQVEEGISWNSIPPSSLMGDGSQVYEKLKV